MKELLMLNRQAEPQYQAHWARLKAAMVRPYNWILAEELEHAAAELDQAARQNARHTPQQKGTTHYGKHSF